MLEAVEHLLADELADDPPTIEYREIDTLQFLHTLDEENGGRSESQEPEQLVDLVLVEPLPTMLQGGCELFLDTLHSGIIHRIRRFLLPGRGRGRFFALIACICCSRVQ